MPTIHTLNYTHTHKFGVPGTVEKHRPQYPSCGNMLVRSTTYMLHTTAVTILNSSVPHTFAHLYPFLRESMTG